MRIVDPTDFHSEMSRLDASRTCCFTGHRPLSIHKAVAAENTKCPLEKYDSFKVIQNLKEMLTTEITRSYIGGTTNFISGGALGVDQWVIQILLNMKHDQYPDINIVVARPFPSQATMWHPSEQVAYDILLEQVDLWGDVNSDPYVTWKMHARNDFMLKHSNTLIAVKCSNIETGGAVSTLNKALHIGKKVVEIDPIAPNITHHNF